MSASAFSLVHWLPSALLILVYLLNTPRAVDTRLLQLGLILASAVLVLTLVNSSLPNALLVGFAVAATFAVPALLAARMPPNGWRFVAQGFVAGVVANLVFGSVMAIAEQKFPLSGFAAHPNTLGALVALAAPMVACLAFFSGRRHYIWLAFAAVLTVGLTGSRSALLALVAAGIVIAVTPGGLVTHRLSSPPATKPSWALPTVLLASLLLLVSVWWLVRQQHVGDFIDLTGRSGLWRVATEMILERPYAGYGPQGWSRNVSDFEASISPQRFPHPHNGAMTLAIDIGLVGLAFVIAYVLEVLSRLTREMRRRPSPLLAAAMAVVAGMLVVNLADSFITDARFVLVAFLIWAAALAYQRDDLTESGGEQGNRVGESRGTHPPLPLYQPD